MIKIVIKNPRLMPGPELWKQNCSRYGYQARQIGKSILDNPYVFKSKAWRWWNEGYRSIDNA